MSTEKDLINGNSSKKKYDHIKESNDAKKIKLENSGEACILRNGVPVPAVLPPTEAQVCKCSHQCNKLTIEEKLTIFNLYHQKTYDQQSEYIVYHCMSIPELQRNVDKVTFLYKLQLGPKIVKVCKKMLCYVLGVTPKRIKILQNKMKNADKQMDLSDHRGKHNRLNKVSEDPIEKIRAHIESVRNNSCSGEADTLEDFDDPVNERLIAHEFISVETLKNEPETVRDSLEADGQLGRMKAEMRTEVMKLLDGSSKSSKVKRPKSPHDVLLLNELIREYFDWIGFKYTSNVLVAECELGKQPLDRSFLAQDLGVKETEKSLSLPLLFCLIETFKELKAASMNPC
ncbi:uncharacterized protein LOC117171230 [Belonocnema kinseyi]|uniref:uncharacterized protein LOC117171230 n=1 Tax=Belonocnema kinseyi TaxID=2817044 RepID=UPI00143D6E29|nr:uncharacterized protein LOC117171230 [Belonocnema kinseyi]